jgi:hypothetical protein
MLPHQVAATVVVSVVGIVGISAAVESETSNAEAGATKAATVKAAAVETPTVKAAAMEAAATMSAASAARRSYRRRNDTKRRHRTRSQDQLTQHFFVLHEIRIAPDSNTSLNQVGSGDRIDSS